MPLTTTTSQSVTKNENFLNGTKNSETENTPQYEMQNVISASSAEDSLSNNRPKFPVHAEEICEHTTYCNRNAEMFQISQEGELKVEFKNLMQSSASRKSLWRHSVSEIKFNTYDDYFRFFHHRKHKSEPIRHIQQQQQEKGDITTERTKEKDNKITNDPQLRSNTLSSSSASTTEKEDHSDNNSAFVQTSNAKFWEQSDKLKSHYVKENPPQKRPKNVKQKSLFDKLVKKTKEKKKGKIKLKKKDPKNLILSFPTNFRHTSHVGQVKKGTFETRNLPEEWRVIFEKAGIRDSDLQEDIDFAVKVVQEVVKDTESNEKKERSCLNSEEQQSSAVSLPDISNFDTTRRDSISLKLAEVMENRRKSRVLPATSKNQKS